MTSSSFVLLLLCEISCPHLTFVAPFKVHSSNSILGLENVDYRVKLVFTCHPDFTYCVRCNKPFHASVSHFHHLSLHTAHPLVQCHLYKCRYHIFMFHTRSFLHLGLREDSTDDNVADIELTVHVSPNKGSSYVPNQHSSLSPSLYCSQLFCLKQVHSINNFVCSISLPIKTVPDNKDVHLPHRIPLSNCHILFEICTSNPRMFTIISLANVHYFYLEVLDQ